MMLKPFILCIVALLFVLVTTVVYAALVVASKADDDTQMYFECMTNSKNKSEG